MKHEVEYFDVVVQVDGKLALSLNIELLKEYFNRNDYTRGLIEGDERGFQRGMQKAVELWDDRTNEYCNGCQVIRDFKDILESAMKEVK